ncbi:ATP-NAD kinase family protein [Psychrosphaera ytuae]|uniref:ATP-NAD kinase family protein n=1 Tax=Psychrosphaera ytuae TaxID=2820710 RepID=A0A975HI32_9GAMM|nr:ATP-NAD kinase family protein [Psychrosphaera ytuae]QTH63718.1 ATP-NAD kinase family protein [Psychrosphaera ytuae]
MTQQRKKFRLGIIVNPLAGIGGAVALKGSDGSETAQLALSKGAVPLANERIKVALHECLELLQDVDVYTVSGGMGSDLCQSLNIDHHVVYDTQGDITTAKDTETAARVLSELDMDLILFAGGDGTARNICASVSEGATVLGVPAGCKIHSGVYAITPKAAGRIVKMMISGELLSLHEADVMDIDEVLFRQGIVKAKRFGELKIPAELRYVQNVKMGGKESDELVLQDIAAHVIEEMEEETLYVMGSGSTVEFLMEELGCDNTLLGVDVVLDHQVIASDVTSSELIELTSGKKVKLVITLIGGQGHIFGRGNQQLSPDFIKNIGRENIIVVATKTKLKALNGRPLIADTGDAELDKALSGPIEVVTGYHDMVVYPIGYEEL